MPPNPFHKVVRGNNSSGPLGAPASAYQLIDTTPKARPAPPPTPEPVEATTHLGKFQAFARANPPKDTAEKQRYLRMAHNAKIADNPMPQYDNKLSPAENTNALNEWYRLMGYSVRATSCPAGMAVPATQKVNRFGVPFDPIRSR